MLKTEILKSWLKDKMTLDEVERAGSVDMDKAPRAPQVPFGYINDQWEDLKAEAVEGDELWSFRSSDETWTQLAGRAGYALVRDGVVVDFICNVMN